jgi:hypothetical protein
MPLACCRLLRAANGKRQANGADESSFLHKKHWTLKQPIQAGSVVDAAGTMGAICGRYWYPIYVLLATERICTARLGGLYTDAVCEAGKR